VAVALAVISPRRDESGAMLVMLIAMLAGVVLVLLGYYVIFEALNGQTPANA
jgi:hypothetical protein